MSKSSGRVQGAMVSVIGATGGRRRGRLLLLPLGAPATCGRVAGRRPVGWGSFGKRKRTWFAVRRNLATLPRSRVWSKGSRMKKVVR